MSGLYINSRIKISWIDRINIWQKPNRAWVNQDGNWVPVKKIFINSDGAWKQVVPSTGIVVYTAGDNQKFVVPQFVTKIYFSGAGGGGAAGNIVDGGRNDDYGGAGSGSGGQRVINFPINVIPGETINITVGAGGGHASGGRGQYHTAPSGGNTVLTCSSGTYTLLGGGGGKGGVGDAGNLFDGGVTSTVNASIPAITVDIGRKATTSGAKGGAGLIYNTSSGTVSLGVGKPGASYGSGGAWTDKLLDATEYGGGGAGGYFGYIREDNGNNPGWGGRGYTGIAVIKW